MDEHVTLDVVADQEAEAAGRVEPFHGAVNVEEPLFAALGFRPSSVAASSTGSLIVGLHFPARRH